MTRLRQTCLPECPKAWLAWGGRVLALCMMLIILAVTELYAASSSAAPQNFFVRIGLSWLPQSQFAGYIMAHEKGFFAAKALDVRLMWTAPGEKPVDMLDKGEVEFATASLYSAMMQWCKGVPLKHVAQLHQRSTLMLVTHKEIQRLDQLNGQMVQAWNTDTRNILSLLFKTNNITPSQVLPQSASLTPFLAGLVGGVLAHDFNEYLQLQEFGLTKNDFNVFSFADYGFGFAGDGLYTLQDFAHEHDSVVRRVREAIMEGWIYAFTHEQETTEIVAEYAEKNHSHTNAMHQQAMLNVIRDVMTNNGTVPQEQMGILRQQDFDFAKKTLMQHGYTLDNLVFENFTVAP